MCSLFHRVSSESVAATNVTNWMFLSLHYIPLPIRDLYCIHMSSATKGESMSYARMLVMGELVRSTSEHFLEGDSQGP